MHYIGKLNREIYQCITNDIVTDDVIITEQQIAHILERHPDDYIICERWASLIIDNPDYIIQDSRPNTGIILKNIQENGKNYRLVLRIKTSTDPASYKNSIITFQKIRQREWDRLIRNKKILYKKV